MIKLLLICIFFTFPYQFQASQPSIKTKSITPDTRVSFSTKNHQPSTKTTSTTHDTRMSFPTRKSAHGSKSSDSGKKHSDIGDQLINKPTPPIVKDKTPSFTPTALPYGSDSENNTSRDDDFCDDESEFVPSTTFSSGVQCATIGAVVIVYSIAAAGLVVTAPLAIGAGFVALGAGFFMQDAQEKSVEKIAQEKLIVAVALENLKEDKPVLAIQKNSKKDDACIAKCKEIKQFLADYSATKKNSKSPADRVYNPQQKEMQELIATFILATKIQELLSATSVCEKAEIIQKIVDILNQLQNKSELLFVDLFSVHDKKAEQRDSSVAMIQEDFNDLVSFFENVDCEEFLQNNEKLAGRILATSAAAPVLIFSAEALAALGPLAPLGAAIIAGGLFLENREAIFNLIHDLKEGNYFKTSQEKLALEELKKYCEDLKNGIDRVIHIGYEVSITADNIFLSSLNYDDRYPNAYVLTIVDKHYNQTVFLIPYSDKISVRLLTADDGILGYKISQQAIDERKAAIAMQQQLEINAKNAEKQAAIDKVLAQAEKKQPPVDKYNKLPSHDHLLPTQGSGRLFQAAYSKNGTMLRNKSAGYYDIQGNLWTLNEEKQQWTVTNSFDSNRFIINVRDQNPPSCPIIDTTPDPINDDQSNPPVDPVNPVTPSDNISMDGGLVIPPVTTGCGGKGDHPDVPTILITPMPEPEKPTILTTPISEPPVQESPGCGKPLPIDDAINGILPGCGGKIDVMPENLILKAQQEQLINESFMLATIDNNEASSANAQANLDKKLRALEKAPENAVRTEVLPDGRIRYYDIEKESKTPGPTRGASFVTEYDPTTGQVRAWYECYDQEGNVNRVHPKTLNGQDLIAQHYPPTKSELESFQKD